MPIPMDTKQDDNISLDNLSPDDAESLAAMVLEPEHRFGYLLGTALEALNRVAIGGWSEAEVLEAIHRSSRALASAAALIEDHLGSIQNDAGISKPKPDGPAKVPEWGKAGQFPFPPIQSV